MSIIPGTRGPFVMAGEFPQNVIITGASTGIGKSLAKQMASKGYRVGLLARRAELLKEVAEEIQQSGGQAVWEAADIKNRHQTRDSIQKLVDRLGGIDILVANAGVGAPTTLKPWNVEDQEAMIIVNLLGVIYSMESVLPLMLDNKKGHLVAISSLAAFKGLPGESGYTASKAGLNTFMEGLRIQLRSKGIHVSTICPGFIRTPMTEVNDFKMPWLLEAEEAAAIILKGIQRKVRVLRFPWQTSLLMRIVSWLPDWLIDKVMVKYNEAPPMPGKPL